MAHAEHPCMEKQLRRSDGDQMQGRARPHPIIPFSLYSYVFTSLPPIFFSLVSSQIINFTLITFPLLVPVLIHLNLYLVFLVLLPRWSLSYLTLPMGLPVTFLSPCETWPSIVDHFGQLQSQFLVKLSNISRPVLWCLTLHPVTFTTGHGQAISHHTRSMSYVYEAIWEHPRPI